MWLCWSTPHWESVMVDRDEVTTTYDSDEHERAAGEVIPDPWDDPDQEDWPTEQVTEARDA